MKSVYAIGDVQGCHQQMVALVDKVKTLSPEAEFLFVGDLVNRGPASLEALRFIRSLGSSAKVLLGNHDLHLLAVANGIRKTHRSDTLDAILAAPDSQELFDWLRCQPLARFESGHLLVHAGVLPQWTTEQTLALAQEVSTVLSGPDWLAFLRQMYGNTPTRWDNALTGVDRLRCIVNALTRMRYCHPDGTMELDNAEKGADASTRHLPWFDLPERKTAETPIVFGHWSALGLTVRENLIGLDSGCIWGGKLSAVNLADHAIVQVSCPQYQKPGV